MKLVIRCLVCLVAVLSAFPALAADHWKTDKATGCRVEAPQTWEKYTVQWTGACVAGFADGSGVLKGSCRAKQGVLEIGVIETDNGYIAGRFEDGKPVEDGDRQTSIDAFHEAVAGANQASEFYRQKGNTASAKYYSQKAKSLDQQMD